MWISRSELRRLLQQVAVAEKRAADAEDRLAAERASKDWLTVQLASRVVTKGGQYGLDHESPASSAPSPRTYPRQLTEEDIAKRDYYVRCYREAGRSEEDAVALFEAEMRGERVVYPYESEAEQ
jgi:hypothetical protein